MVVVKGSAVGMRDEKLQKNSGVRRAAKGWQIMLAAALVMHGAGAFAQALDAQSSSPSSTAAGSSSTQGAASAQPMSSAPQKLAPAKPTDDSDAAAGVAGPAQPSEVSQTGGNVAELQRRIAAKELAELRTVYNGSYGASLLMATNDPTYYVALFERKNFWRVIKTQNDARAEAIFAEFARQTGDLAQSEIRSVKLAAQRSAIEQLIGLNKDRAAQIQADLAVQQSQQQAVTERQRQAQAQASELASENRKAQGQLEDLRRQLDDLQKEANAGLPSTTTTSGRRR